MCACVYLYIYIYVIIYACIHGVGHRLELESSNECKLEYQCRRDFKTISLLATSRSLGGTSFRSGLRSLSSGLERDLVALHHRLAILVGQACFDFLRGRFVSPRHHGLWGWHVIIRPMGVACYH